MSNKENILALQKENKDLLDKVEDLLRELKAIQDKVTTNDALESNGPQSLPPPMQSMQGLRGSWRGQPRGRWVTNNSRGGARTGPNTRARSSQNSKKN